MKLVILLLISLTLSYYSHSQQISDTLYNAIQDGIKIKLKNQEKAVVTLGFNSQIWMRYMQLNPGTFDYQGNEVTSDADILLRRTSIYTHFSVDRFTLFLQMAIGQQANTISVNPTAPNKPVIYLYDAWGSYKIHKDYIIAGMGLNMYNGISRLSSASSSKTLTIDLATISNPNLVTDDQSGRQLSFFVTGNFGQFSYRAAIAKPFISNTVPDSITVYNKVYQSPNHNYSFKSYVEWQFFDKESNSMPFKTGTYIGKKKILNIGAGFDYHPNATVLYKTQTTREYFNNKQFGVDLFLDLPFANRSAITFYLAEYWSDYGPNYTLSFGAVDIYKNGISEYQYGTGNSTLLQTAFLLPSEHNTNRLQPFYELTIRSFDGLGTRLYHHNLGLNCFVIDQKIKLTLQYENRPYYDGSYVSRKSMVIGMLQFGI